MKTVLASVLVLLGAISVAACGKGSVAESVTLAELEAVCQKMSSGSEQYAVVKGTHWASGAGATKTKDGDKMLLSTITLIDGSTKKTLSLEYTKLSDYDFEHLDQNGKYKKHSERFQTVIYDHKRLADYKKNPNYKKRVYGICGRVHEDNRGEETLFYGDLDTLTHLNDQGPT